MVFGMNKLLGFFGFGVEVEGGFGFEFGLGFDGGLGLCELRLDELPMIGKLSLDDDAVVVDELLGMGMIGLTTLIKGAFEFDLNGVGLMILVDGSGGLIGLGGTTFTTMLGL